VNAAHVGLVAIALTVLPRAGSLLAQGAPALTPGQRVRVTAPASGLDRAVGTVRAVRGRVIVLAPEWARPAWSRPSNPADSLGVPVPLDSVRSLEVSLGTHSHFWSGAGTGAVVGGVGLAIVGAASASDCQGFICFSPAAAAAGGLVVGGLIGGLLGGIVGAATVTDRWVSVPLGGDRLSLRVAPTGRLGLGASLAF